MFCSNCGSQNADTAKFCERCGNGLVAASPPPPETRMRTVESVASSPPVATAKNPWVALVLSLVIVGVGQFYNGDYKKGGVMLLAGIIGLAVSAGLITLAVWIWSMYDAFQVASGKGKPW